MSDFLDFLNTAELDALTKTPGISRPLAGNIIAARPFDSVDDCLKVRGMGKNLLARMESDYKAGESAGAVESQPEENRAMVAVNTPPIEKSQPAQETPKAGQPSFLSRLGKAFANFLLALFKLILTLAFITAIGAGLYYGVPYVNDNLFKPIEKNTADIYNLEAQVKDLQLHLDAMNLRVGDIEKTIEAHTASITKLEEMQAALEEEVSTQNNSVMVSLKREIMFTRAIETLARARMYLAQSNFGLAKQDVQSARDLLAGLKSSAPEYQLGALDSILARLDLALGNLPAFPVIAASDVDIAWELMMMGLPESAADANPESTPLPPTLEATPTTTP